MRIAQTAPKDSSPIINSCCYVTSLISSVPLSSEWFCDKPQTLHNLIWKESLYITRGWRLSLSFSLPSFLLHNSTITPKTINSNTIKSGNTRHFAGFHGCLISISFYRFVCLHFCWPLFSLFFPTLLSLSWFGTSTVFSSKTYRLFGP